MECPISQRKKILALETQIQMLQKEKKKPKQDSQKDGGKEGFRKSKKQKKKEKELSKWMKVPPFQCQQGQAQNHQGKEYLWCAKHARWGRHITSACKGKGLNKDLKVTQEPLPSLQMTARLGLSRELSTIVLSDSQCWSQPGGTSPPVLMATINWLQKWG